MKHNLLLLILLIFGTMSCKEDNEKPIQNEDSQLTVYEKNLTGHRWTLTSQTHTTPQGDVTEYVTQSCTNDDIYEMKVDKSWTYEAGVKCNPNDPQSYGGTWKIVANKFITVRTSSGYTSEMDIMELTEKSL